MYSRKNLDCFICVASVCFICTSIANKIFQVRYINHAIGLRQSKLFKNNQESGFNFMMVRYLMVARRASLNDKQLLAIRFFFEVDKSLHRISFIEKRSSFRMYVKFKSDLEKMYR